MYPGAMLNKPGRIVVRTVRRFAGETCGDYESQIILNPENEAEITVVSPSRLTLK
jgi:hypothetical protein